MRNKLFALCCVVWIVSCCEIQDKDFSVGQLHNMALSDSARSLYHQLNHILIHQSQVEQTADTLLARISENRVEGNRLQISVLRKVAVAKST